MLLYYWHRLPRRLWVSWNSQDRLDKTLSKMKMSLLTARELE